MLFFQVGPETLNKELNNYLGHSKLSLSQVAKRLGISKGHLSEIKNGKAEPALNTGLRILKMCGLETEQRKAWAHFYNSKISEEYQEVHIETDKINAKNLTEKVSTLLAKDLEIMNAYVDIVSREERGMELVELALEYGKGIEKKLQKLVNQNVLSVETVNSRKCYKAGLVDPIMTANASYDLIKSVVEVQQYNFQAGEHKGHFKFHINDLDETGYNELEQLMNRTMKEATDIFLKHQKRRLDGGERFAFEMMLGKIKSFVIFMLLSLAPFGFNTFEVNAQGGGLTGGFTIMDIQSEIKDLSIEEISSSSPLRVSWPKILMNKEFININNLCHTSKNNTLSTRVAINNCIDRNKNYHCFLNTTLPENSCELIQVSSTAKNITYNFEMQDDLTNKNVCDKEESKSHHMSLEDGEIKVRFNDLEKNQITESIFSDSSIKANKFKFNVNLFIEEPEVKKVGTGYFEIPKCY